MSRLRECALLVRQLLAHNAWALRRALAEAAALPLVRLAPVWPAAGRMALRLHPRSPAALEGLARGAERRGHTELAQRHRRAAEEAARNTLDTSVLEAMRAVFARRAEARSATHSHVEGALDEGALESNALPVGQRIDELLARARRTATPADVLSLMEEAVDLDPGRSDAWRELGRARADSGREAESARAYEHALDLDPLDVDAWALLGRALGRSAAAGRVWKRALDLDPTLDEALLGIESLEGAATPGATPPVLGLTTTSIDLEVGSRTLLRVHVELVDEGALHVMEPTSGGLACTPRGRLPLAAGSFDIDIEIEARRPRTAAAGRPWCIQLAAISGPCIERAVCVVSVADPEPGRIYHIVTEDHELYDERETTSASEARTTLVEKSRMAEQLANAAGGRWTHVVDVGSLALVEWAADRDSTGKWQDVASACREHLTDAVEAGNDLGLHCHGFHDPESDVFCHGFDAETARITTDPGFLERPGRERGFWSRAYPRLGDIDDRGSRAWATWRGIGRLESLGRLADPRFRVTLFRAGSFDFGDDPEERARSLALLQRMGLLADSDVPKPRLYIRPMSPATYPVDTDPARPAAEPARMRALELRAEYNVESDFLSDRGVLDRYLARRIDDCRDAQGAVRPGTHVVCAMTHDKFINWRMGRRWDSLDPDYGDWVTIREHLEHAAAAHSDLRFARARDAVLDWYEHWSPRLVAWRDEEIAVLGSPGAEVEEFVYSVRLLGRGIEVGPDRPRTVRVALPAWAHGLLREAWIERDGERWQSRQPAGVPGLEFEVDSLEVEWDLRVRLSPGEGIQIDEEIGDERPSRTLLVSSALAYRRATVEIPATVAGRERPLRVRGVRLVPDGDRHRGRIALSDSGSNSDSNSDCDLADRREDEAPRR